MARDYKHTVRSSKKKPRPTTKVGLWRWMLVAALLIVFAVFLTYLKINSSKHPADTPPIASGKDASKTVGKNKAVAVAKQEQKNKKAEPVQPHFEFYTVLPNKEAVVPDHEISTRLREERIGKTKEGKYNIQAGSFKAFNDADQLKAKLALMGMESKVEKAKVGETDWYRVKIGPYAQIGSVDKTKKRLKDNGIDAIVLEAASKTKTATAAKPTKDKASPQR